MLELNKREIFARSIMSLAVAKKFVARMLTRDLFALANLCIILLQHYEVLCVHTPRSGLNIWWAIYAFNNAGAPLPLRYQIESHFAMYVINTQAQRYRSSYRESAT